MSVRYTTVSWNPQKERYDVVLAALSVAYIATFMGIGILLHPNATIETLLIRGLGTLALLMLHVALAIGPLCRLDRRFLPLLYNRRHLGVATFLVGLSHGSFTLVQFHAYGDVDPLTSLLASNTRFQSVSQFPFQLLGFLALVILFLMAATSHDFWLHTLSARAWKRIHMMVYVAYGLLVAHVALGVLQSETSPILASILVTGAAALCVLHLMAAERERRIDDTGTHAHGFVPVCEFNVIPDGRARVVSLDGERIAVFRYQGKVLALSNVCRHQNGPLGEGKIVGGCVTCPWHGYQYSPETGMAPPPFNDRVATYAAKVVNGLVLVNPTPFKGIAQ
jgi:methionine sulfoxide reductase heme-binding subunit